MKIQFVKQDCWIGLFWKTTAYVTYHQTTYYLCVLPCFPIIWHGRKVMYSFLNEEQKQLHYERYADKNEK